MPIWIIDKSAVTEPPVSIVLTGGICYCAVSILFLISSSVLGAKSIGMYVNGAVCNMNMGLTLTNETITAPENCEEVKKSARSFIKDNSTNKPAKEVVFAPVAHTHNLTKHAAKSGSCLEDGNTVYWECSDCGQFFRDKDGKKPVAKDSWVIERTGHDLTATPYKAGTCTAAGNKAYWTCTKCNKVYSDKNGKTETTVAKSIIPAKKHKWGTPTYKWFGDNKTVTATRVCLNDKKHTQTETVKATAKTTNPTYLIKEFRKIINDTDRVSMNILTEKDVQPETVNGKSIVVIRVPRAECTDKPIYIDGDPIKGSYRRNGDGDCHCTKDEVEAMLRDAAGRSQDMLVLENMGLYVFDYGIVIRQCCSEGSFSTLRYTFDISRSVRHIFF